MGHQKPSSVQKETLTWLTGIADNRINIWVFPSERVGYQGSGNGRLSLLLLSSICL